MSLDSRWLVCVRDNTRQNPDKWVTLSDLDSYINVTENAAIGDLKTFTGIGSKGERTNIDADLTTLETLVGDYTPYGEDIAADLDTVYKDVETASTGIKAIIAAPASTPIMAQTYATGRLTFGGEVNPTDGDTITVGSITYTFKDTLNNDGAHPNQILIAATSVPDDTCINIEKAINDSGTEETHYSKSTTANPDVIATADDNIVDLTTEGSVNDATLLGVAGNAVVTTTSAGFAEASFGSTHLTGGLDVTSAAGGKIIVGSGAIYVAKATMSDGATNSWAVISYDAAP